MCDTNIYSNRDINKNITAYNLGWLIGKITFFYEHAYIKCVNCGVKSKLDNKTHLRKLVCNLLNDGWRYGQLKLGPIHNNIWGFCCKECYKKINFIDCTLNPELNHDVNNYLKDGGIDLACDNKTNFGTFYADKKGRNKSSKLNFIQYYLKHGYIDYYQLNMILTHILTSSDDSLYIQCKNCTKINSHLDILSKTLFDNINKDNRLCAKAYNYMAITLLERGWKYGNIEITSNLNNSHLRYKTGVFCPKCCSIHEI